MKKIILVLVLCLMAVQASAAFFNVVPSTGILTPGAGGYNETLVNATINIWAGIWGVPVSFPGYNESLVNQTIASWPAPTGESYNETKTNQTIALWPAPVIFDPINQDRNITELWTQGNAQTNDITAANTTANNAATSAANTGTALGLNATKYDAYMADTSVKITANDSLKVNKAGDTMSGDLNTTGINIQGTTVRISTASISVATPISPVIIQSPSYHMSFRVNSSAAAYAAFAYYYNDTTWMYLTPDPQGGISTSGMIFRTDGANLGKRFYPYDNGAYDLGSSSYQWKSVWGVYAVLNDTLHRGNNQYLIRDVEKPEGLATQYIPWITIDATCGERKNADAECWSKTAESNWNTTYHITRTYDGGLIYEGELLTNSKGYEKANKSLKNVVSSVQTKADGQIDHTKIDPSLLKNGHISIDARIGALEQLLTQVVNESCSESKGKYSYCS